MHSNHSNTNAFYNFSVILFKIFAIAAFFVLSVVVANASVYTVTKTNDRDSDACRFRRVTTAMTIESGIYTAGRIQSSDFFESLSRLTAQQTPMTAKPPLG